MKEKCTILVNSNDKYDDLWNPFFKLFQYYWNDCPFDIILNTESKHYEHETLDIKTYSMYSPNMNVAWGERFIKHLKKIETEYVLILLDDFFFRQKVNGEKIEKIINWMDQDQDAAVFSFVNVTDTEGNIKTHKYPGFYKRPKKGKYKFNLQAGIWRTEDLKRYILPHESPWDWETIGNIRSYILDKDFYAYDYLNNEPIIDYGKKENGWAVVGGKWEIEDVKPLFKKHEIDIDYNKRGFYDSDYSLLLREKVPTAIKNRVRYCWQFYKSLGFSWWKYFM